MRRAFFISILLLSTAALHAQDWTAFGRGAVFATYVTETGPRKPETRLFSTNWFEGGVRRAIGADGSLELRGRVSLEPLTIPRDGYPQLLQYVSPASGGPLLDRMRALELVQEVALRASWRGVRLDIKPVGDPPIGPSRFEQRESSIDFAEAPFGYDVQEAFQRGTRLAALGFDTHAFTVEGGVFHASTTYGRHTGLGDGKVDSWSGRAILRPVDHLAIQISRGSFGDEHRKITSGSVTYEGSLLAASAIWTRQEPGNGLQTFVNPVAEAIGVELSIRATRNVLSLRVEDVDRPAATIYPAAKRTAHFTIGDVVEVAHVRGLRTGVGVNIDYQTQTREIQSRYGHKPQSVYLFFRMRT